MGDQAGRGREGGDKLRRRVGRRTDLTNLTKGRLEISDLFSDFADGILLMKSVNGNGSENVKYFHRFLEIISGEKLGKPNRGRMRVQKIENLNR